MMKTQTLTALHGQWRRALERYRANDTDRNCDREQAAHDALVDYVEANDMNYSEWDPRGPREGATCPTIDD